MKWQFLVFVAPAVWACGLIVAPKSDGGVPYVRSDWPHWSTSNCLTTREHVLIEESLTPAVVASCNIASGNWTCPYTNTANITSASALDVDHMVALENAHTSGGWAWDRTKKTWYANNRTWPEHLIAVTLSSNRAKGSSGPEDWLPPYAPYLCTYVTDWVAIKSRWNLTATEAECAAITVRVGRTGVGFQKAHFVHTGGAG